LSISRRIEREWVERTKFAESQIHHPIVVDAEKICAQRVINNGGADAGRKGLRPTSWAAK
jgi:hypothetical protein